MDEITSKPQLLATLRSTYAQWEALLTAIGEARMTKAGALGEWTVKDVIAHLTAYADWYATAMENALRGEPPPQTGTEWMPFEERNQLFYRRDKAKPLQQVLADSQETIQRLMAGVEAHSEAFLTQPQQFEGAPSPVVIWKMLEADCYGHCQEHMAALRAWLDKQNS